LRYLLQWLARLKFGINCLGGHGSSMSATESFQCCARYRNVGAVANEDADAHCHYAASSIAPIASTTPMRWPIHRMTGTAIEFPRLLYRGPSAAGFPR
jgi:hypothetical protein